MLILDFFYKKIFILILFFCFFIFSSFANEQNIQLSKLNRCVTCHTLSGNSLVSIWPKIAEQHFDYVVKQLLEFKKGKSGDRFDPNMFAMLQGVSEEELYELADYYSKQVLDKTKGVANKSLYEEGKKIYLFGDSKTKLTGCVGCHGIDGYGNKLAKFPILKWQHKDYLVLQLKKFRSGDRANDFNSIMRDIASIMTDDQILAVSEYLSFIN